MYKRILVPLDGSTLSENAVEPASKLASSFGAALHLVQVISRHQEREALRAAGVHAAVSAMEEARRRAVREKASAGSYLSALAARLRGEGIQVESAVMEGYAHEKILEYAKENEIDLVAISTHGYGGFKRMFLGSVTDRIVRSGQLSVLVIPSGSAD